MFQARTCTMLDTKNHLKTTVEKWPKNVWKRIPLLMQWHVKPRGKGSRKIHYNVT